MTERTSSEPTAHTCRRCYAPYVLIADGDIVNPRARVRLCDKCMVTYNEILKRHAAGLDKPSGTIYTYP